MECNEKFLREMFASPYGNTVGQAIIERLEQGKSVTIHLADGGNLHLPEPGAAFTVLVERFGWRPVLASSGPSPSPSLPSH